MRFDDTLTELSRSVIERFRDSKVRVATAESCTGGLVSSLLTSIPGSSEVFDRGFVTYSNAAKEEMIGVSGKILTQHGAVSSQVAGEMALGALAASNAGAVVAVTGIAGPGGGSREKPVGLVFIGVAATGSPGVLVEEFRFGEIGRDQIRSEAAKMALEMLLSYGLDTDN